MTHNCQTILQPCLTPAVWAPGDMVQIQSPDGRPYFFETGSKIYKALCAIAKNGSTVSEVTVKLGVDSKTVPSSMHRLFRYGLVIRKLSASPLTNRTCYKYWKSI